MVKEYKQLLKNIQGQRISKLNKYRESLKSKEGLKDKEAQADSIAMLVLGALEDAPLEASDLYQEEEVRLNQIIETNHCYEGTDLLQEVLKKLLNDTAISKRDISMLKELAEQKKKTPVFKMVQITLVGAYTSLVRQSNMDTLERVTDEMSEAYERAVKTAVDKERFFLQGQLGEACYFAFEKCMAAGEAEALCKHYYAEAYRNITAYLGYTTAKEYFSSHISMDVSFATEYALLKAIKENNPQRQLDLLLAENPAVDSPMINKHRSELFKTALPWAASERINLTEHKEQIDKLAKKPGMGGEHVYKEYIAQYNKQCRIAKQQEAERKKAEAKKAQAAQAAQEEAKRRAEERKKLGERKAQEALQEEKRQKQAARMMAARTFIKKCLSADKLHLTYCPKDWLAVDPTGDLKALEAYVENKASEYVAETEDPLTKETLKAWIKEFYNRPDNEYHERFQNLCYEAVKNSYKDNIDAYVRKKVTKLPRYAPDATLEEHLERYDRVRFALEVTNLLRQIADKKKKVEGLTDRELQEVFELTESIVKGYCEEHSKEHKTIGNNVTRLVVVAAFILFSMVYGFSGIDTDALSMENLILALNGETLGADNLKGMPDAQIYEYILKVVKQERGRKVSETATPAEEFEYRIDGDYVEITRYNGRSAEVEIPCEIERKPVTVIGQDAFANNMYLEKVVLPDTILTIGQGAFYHCEKLTHVDASTRLVSIERQAFEGCASLISFDKRESEDSIGYWGIGYQAFAYCTALKNFDFSGDTFGEMTIDTNAFLECASLQSVKLGENTRHIKDYAFGACTALSEVVIPANISRIYKCAFIDCTNLTTVTLEGRELAEGDEGAEIDHDAFRNTGITEIVIPTSYKIIGERAFFECVSLSKVTFEERELSFDEDGQYIYGKAFAGTALTEVVVPGNYSGIGGEAFGNCSNLICFTWKDSGRNAANQTLGGNVFEGSLALTEVHLPMTVESIDGWNPLALNNPTVYLPAGSAMIDVLREWGVTVVEE